MSPRQVSYEYHEQQQRTLLGFGVYHKNEQEKLVCLNIDLVSNIPTQTAYDSINGFKY